MAFTANGKMLLSFVGGSEIQANNILVKNVNNTAVFADFIVTVAASASAVSLTLPIAPTNPVYYFQELNDQNSVTVSVTISAVARTMKVQPIMVTTDAISAVTFSNSSTTATTMRVIIFGSSS